MKNYDEIAQGLFERREEYLKEQIIKKSRIKKAAVSTATVAAVALIGTGMWKSGILNSKNISEAAAQLEAKEKKTEIVTALQFDAEEKSEHNTDNKTDSKNEKNTKGKSDNNSAEKNDNSKASSESDGKKNKSDNGKSGAVVSGKGGESVSSDVISKAESDCTYGMPCYATPEDGTYFLALPVQWSVDKHGSSKKYLLYINITKDGKVVSDAEKSAELKRLKNAGCDIKKYTCSYYESDGVSKGYYTQLGGVFTKEQLETLFTGREYGYFFDFMAGSDINPDDVLVDNGGEFFEKTTKKGENYPSEYN